MNYLLREGSALIRIDLQNDFITGSLAVPDGDAIIEPINYFSAHGARGGCLVVDTQDWHPYNHSSFASNHEGRQPFETIEMPYGEQTLWPNHCVQGSHGAALAETLDTDSATVLIRKGTNPKIDSYSVFFENDRTTRTGLNGILTECRITRVFLVGLAYDFCVGYSALDAARLGYEVVVIRNLCRAINLNGSEAAMTQQLLDAGVQIVNSGSIGHVK